MWDSWGWEAYRLNQEKRPHYILDSYPAFLEAEKYPKALEKLLAARQSRRQPGDWGSKIWRTPKGMGSQRPYISAQAKRHSESAVPAWDLREYSSEFRNEKRR